MSIRKQCDSYTFLASADLSDKQYTFVYQDGANTVASAADAQNSSEANVFILQNAPASGEEAECAVLGTGQSLLKIADASASVGDEIMISASGLGTARAGVNKYARARIDEAVTAANQIVVVNTTEPIYVVT